MTIGGDMLESKVIKIPAPKNLNATLAKVKAEVEKENGTFVGDEKHGIITGRAFVKNDIQGEYSLSGNEIIIKIVKKPALAPFSIIQKEIVETFMKSIVD